VNTIVCLTDNSIQEPLATKCRTLLRRVAEGIPIVSVSQRPIDLGRNVCVGEIGRSWLSLYRQILAGLDAVETGNVVIAEHDCLYTREHLTYEPTDNGAFYYNHNHWLVEWGGNHPELDGMYSYWPRRTALSQLVCSRDLLRQATEEVMRLLDMGLKVERGLHWYGEPGVVSEQFRKAFVEASSGRPTQLQTYLKEYVTHYKSEVFHTTLPNLDIRHSGNFTGPKRGKMRRYELEPWGRFADLMGG
jgi:hypothetical protein